MHSWLTKPWQPVEGFSSRAFTGLTLAPHYPQDGRILVYGPGEGLWLSADAGASWQALSEDLPFSETNHLISYTKDSEVFSLLAASPDGLWISYDCAQSWQQLIREPCESTWASASGKNLLASLPRVGLRLSHDSGATWRDLPGAWQQGGHIVACQINDRQQITIALLENLQESVSIWQGQPGKFEEVIRLPAPANPLVSFWTPPEALPDRPWYASLGGQVWKFSSRRSGARAHSSLLPGVERSEAILTLTGLQSVNQIGLFACTGRRLFHSTDDARSWVPFYDFGNRRLVSLSLRQLGQEVGFIALFLGGELGAING